MSDSLNVQPFHATPASRRLTGRQLLFCNRIAGGASGAEAARQAGYSGAAAAQQAWRLLKNAEVQAEIERIRNAAALRAQAELDRLLSKVEGVFVRAYRDGQCSPALDAIRLEAILRSQGAQTLPDDVMPSEILETRSDPGEGSPRLGMSDG